MEHKLCKFSLLLYKFRIRLRFFFFFFFFWYSKRWKRASNSREISSSFYCVKAFFFFPKFQQLSSIRIPHEFPQRNISVDFVCHHVTWTPSDDSAWRLNLSSLNGKTKDVNKLIRISSIHVWFIHNKNSWVSRHALMKSKNFWLKFFHQDNFSRLHDEQGERVCFHFWLTRVMIMNENLQIYFDRLFSKMTAFWLLKKYSSLSASRLSFKLFHHFIQPKLKWILSKKFQFNFSFIKFLFFSLCVMP